ncbi:MAG: hypothetical protein ACSLFP_08630 [Acidimicrobiales bacterium]
MAKDDPVDRAEGWLDDHTQPEGDRPQGLEHTDGPSDVAELRQQQQDEMTHTGLGSPAQSKGAALGWIAGAIIGAIIAFAVSFLVVDSMAGRVVLTVVGACAGSAAFFVYWGGRNPELENETMTAQGRPGIGTTPRDSGTDDRGR